MPLVEERRDKTSTLKVRTIVFSISSAALLEYKTGSVEYTEETF